ncbi:LRR_1 domain-containing protein/Pkinase_Tyr domain-containing protein/LRRNT_2 domain-containing protein/LRR_8 domain-containing protein [Cephalotus follicularis]|uniref:LRR_1 domain-containing protein/Pkinase_Tyr domain-containing protein/LRRNT_2 domain-containing protein/LRR_8 domain-containing protein n=1 Tax=Cephalotus follicularis TaxID=3775 RepID=A0A1Q3BAJ4_CEPFO|nr:LRR_1 domain-containing protein/Pkinase_Tyr domain-containing protein/LRRNT_2 domain-containing protein/LRR_8 domain-containing protein [Cephalotus follicularis]
MDFTLLLFSLLLLFTKQTLVCANTELQALMDMKSALDPQDQLLASWTKNGDPCDGSFQGIACNEKGQVANISLQGKGLHGKVSPAIAGLKQLTGLYLHYNSLYGKIPREIANLTELSDLYLNVNNLSGEIPSEIGTMGSLQVLQLCYNQFTGSIPTQLGSLKKLNVLALQSNRLTGAIPASLGELNVLMRLDLSFNRFFGSIPAKLADAPLLEVLDIRNNTLTGNVPLGPFNSSRPKPYGASTTVLPTREVPETADFPMPCNQTRCSSSSKSRQSSVVAGTMVVTIALSAIGVFTFIHYRRRKQKLGSSVGGADSRLSTDQAKGIYRKNGSPLINLEFNLEEVETATQYFSEVNLLSKSYFSATYKGVLRDGSLVAIKSIIKTSCKSDESEFLKGLNLLTSLRHENLVRLRGFCCSKARGECFLIYDFVPNGNLLCYLDVKDDESHVLEWTTRVSIVRGIAKGLSYLHGYKVNRSALIHQNITAEKNSRAVLLWVTWLLSTPPPVVSRRKVIYMLLGCLFSKSSQGSVKSII